jgi:hypothetical protein
MRSLGMNIRSLSGKKIVEALMFWRKAKGKDPKDIISASMIAGKKTVPGSNVTNIEKNGNGFSFDHLMQHVFPAYGINDLCDLDLFLDSCVEHSVETISVIRANERNVINSETKDTTETLISPEHLKGNRARISLIEIKPGKRTKWQNHEGHE